MQSLVPRFIQKQYRAGNFEGNFEAATLFLDITGFTPLTETLFEHQKDGAEVLTNSLKRIFSPMVKEVYSRGGLIPYYAGDAFTAIFPILPDRGEQTVRAAVKRATETALAIQMLFAPDGTHRQMQTKYGLFTIAIKMGLSCGRVNWAIPGSDARRNYYFRGEAINSCVNQEQLAASGEIVASKRFVSLIELDLVTAVSHSENANSYLLYKFTGQTALRKVSEVPKDTALLSTFLSDSVLNLPVEAEFREAAILFISFDDAKAETDALHQFLATVIELTEQYGGTFNQIDFSDKGGLLVLLFGAPVSYEQNAERATEFLYALRRQNWPQQRLLWRAGLTMGTVWAGIRGGKERHEYGVVGSVVNLAARLSIRAGWNELWVSAPVYQKLQDSYWLGELGDFEIKGKVGKVPIFQLLRKKDISEIEQYRGKLIGRVNEMQQLETAVLPIFNKQYGGVVYVHGEAGMGKSRFVHEFHRQLMQNHFLSWFLCPTEEILGHALAPLRTFLLAYFQQENEIKYAENEMRFTAVFDLLIQQLPKNNPIRLDLERQRQLLTNFLILGSDTSNLPQPTFKFQLTQIACAIATLIKAEAMLRPVVVQVEDAHWLDNESRETFQQISAELHNYPVVFLCTARPQKEGEPFQLSMADDIPQTNIHLPHLNFKHIKQLGQQILRTRIADDIANLLIERTNSNPFFIEQLLLDMRSQRVITTELDAQGAYYTLATQDASTLPANINIVLTSRLDQLPIEVKSLVQTAAVLGKRFDTQLLAHMLPIHDQLETNIEQAKKEQIWAQHSDDSVYTFTHSLLRDAAYEMQLRARLRELHLRAAEAYLTVYEFELEGYYGEVAFHYEQALMPKEAARWYRVAGEQSARFYANTEAINYFSKGLVLLPKTAESERYAMLRAREEIFMLLGQRSDQWKDLQEMAQLTSQIENQMLQADCSLRFAHYYKTVGDYATALESAETAVNLARQVNVHQIEMGGQLLWGQTLMLLGELEAAQQRLEIVSRRAHTTSLLNLKADSLSALASLHNQIGLAEKSIQYLNQALPIYQTLRDRQGESTILIDLGIEFGRQGKFFDAQQCFKKAHQIVLETGDMQLLCRVTVNLGALYFELGQFEKSIKTLNEAIQLCHSIKLKFGACIGLVNLAQNYTSLNQATKALTAGRQAYTVAKSLNDPVLVGHAQQCIGIAYMKLGNFSKAATIFLHLHEHWSEHENLPFLLETLSMQAEVNFRQGFIREAVHQVEQILTRLVQGQHIYGVGSPIKIYLTCYRILNVIQDVRAFSLLETAHAILHQRAEHILDPNLKSSYLNNIAIHQEVLTAFTKLQKQPFR